VAVGTVGFARLPRQSQLNFWVMIGLMYMINIYNFLYTLKLVFYRILTNHNTKMANASHPPTPLKPEMSSHPGLLPFTLFAQI